jgi:SnoaL-like domain
MSEPTEVFTRLLHAIDDLDWDSVRACFAERIDLDYTSLWGGTAETVAVDDLVADWRELATGFDATQHLTGPFVDVDRDDQRLTCTTTVRAYHHLVEAGEAATWLVAGGYRVRLVREPTGWRIHGITLRLSYESGDRELTTRARERSVQGVGGRTG